MNDSRTAPHARVAATATSLEPWQIIDLLSALVEKSLVVYEEDARGQGRYRLLETVRQYGRDRLLESGEGDRVRVRHGDFFLALAEEARQHFGTPGQAKGMDWQEAEHDNLRAVLDRLRDEPDGGVPGLRLSWALSGFWQMRGYLVEGREYLAAALAHAGAQERTSVRARTLYQAGWLADCQQDLAAARSFYQEAMSIARERQDRQTIADALGGLGNIAHSEGDLETARALREEALATARASGHQGRIAIALYNVGLAAFAQERYDEAARLWEETLANDRARGHKGGFVFLGLGGMAGKQGDWATAEARYKEGLGEYWEVGNRPNLIKALGGLSEVAAHREQPQRAARLGGAEEALREAIGVPLASESRVEYEGHWAGLRRALGDEAFSVHWSAGRALTPEQAVEYALSSAEEEPS